ncbi:MAG: ABC transporter permease [Deltaproteobacteria bacterium]|nr:ABC transporter permease [Deltaproteobacteria bacterium]
MDAKHRVTVYTSKSPLLEPGRLLRDMFSDLAASLGLTLRLASRDVAAQYRQTALGYLWAILPPLVTSLTFILLNGSNIIDTGVLTLPYPVFVITGTVFWQLFVDALNAPLKIVNSNRAMLSKISFPKEALVLSGILQVLFAFVFKMVLLGLVLAYYRIPIHVTAVACVVPILGLLVIGTLIGMFLVPIGVLYQDVQQALLIAASALMFFTPVVYSPPGEGLLSRIVAANPLSPFLLLCREALYEGTLAYLERGLIILAAAVVLSFAGWVMYRVALPIIIERMDA